MSANIIRSKGSQSYSDIDSVSGLEGKTPQNSQLGKDMED
jgi:hypothetical protein